MDPQSNIPTQTHPVAGTADQPCRGCGALVAEDQRYCVGCGYRRPDKALPFAGIAAGAAAVPVAQASAKSKQSISPALATAIVCLSVLFLGTGVLVGRSAGGSQQAVSAAPAAVTTVAASAGDGAAAADGAAAGGAAKAATKASPTAVAKVPKGAKVLNKAAISSATDCSGLSPAACSKKLAKLPKTIVTPGTPPPKDNKPPAGGGGGTTFN